MLYPYLDFLPTVDSTAFIAPNASVIGKVTLKEGASCWHGAVLRGDEAEIIVGKNSNVQDNSVVHCDRDVPVIIGENVTVGHGVILHSCTIGDAAMIGMGAIVLSRAVVGEGAIIAAGSVVKEGEIVPPYALYAGTPAVFKKQLDPSRRELTVANADEYVKLSHAYPGSAEKE